MLRPIRTDDILILGPVVEPLDLEEVKKHRRVSTTTQDTLFDRWISAARELLEAQTGRQLLTATWEYALDAFPVDRAIELPHPPLQSVLSVIYDTADGAQTLDVADYVVVAPSGPLCHRGRVSLAASGVLWPSALSHPGAVRIRYVAGYGDAPGAVPDALKAALLQLVGDAHTFAEDTIQTGRGAVVNLPRGVQTILDLYQRSALPVLPMPMTTALLTDPLGVIWV